MSEGKGHADWRSEVGGKQAAGVAPEEVTHFASSVISPRASWEGRTLCLLFISTLLLTLTHRSLKQQQTFIIAHGSCGS